MTKQGIVIALLAVTVGLFVLGASPLFVVDVIQTAIVVQLGKPVRNITEPGLYVKVPFVQIFLVQYLSKGFWSSILVQVF